MTPQSPDHTSPCVDDPPFDAGVLVALRADGLSAEERDQAFEHLGRCASCRALLTELGPAESAEVEDLIGLIEAGSSDPHDAVEWPGDLRPPKMKWTLLGVGAMLLGVVLFAITDPPVPADPEPYTAGAVRSLAAGPQVIGAVQTFRTDEPLVWSLAPQSPLKHPPAARAFRLEASHLAELPADALRQAAGGSVEVRGWAADLAGGQTGQVELVVGFAVAKERLRALAGRRWEEARALRGTKWHEATFRVEPPVVVASSEDFRRTYPVP